MGERKSSMLSCTHLRTRGGDHHQGSNQASKQSHGGGGLTVALKTVLPADQWFNESKDTLPMRERLAWKGSKLYVPNCLRLQVLQCSHGSWLASHFRFLKTLHLAWRQFWWAKMKADIEDYVKTCATCATMNMRPGKSPGLLQQVANPSWPWEEIAMDFIVESQRVGGNTSGLWLTYFLSKATLMPARNYPQPGSWLRCSSNKSTTYTECPTGWS